MAWTSIDLKHLRAVVAAAECGSFTAAARRLNVDASAVSRSIRDVETALHIILFDRLARGVRPTPAGADYIAAARDILSRLSEANADARRAAAAGSGRLSIGFVWSFGSGPVVDLLRALTNSYPDLSVRTFEDGNEELIARLESNELDVVLTATDPPPFARLRSLGALGSMPLWLEPLCVAVPRAYGREDVRWEDLAARRLLCQPKDDWRRFAEHVERMGGPTLQFVVQDISREGLIGLVAAGLGWVIVPSVMAQSRIPGVRIVPITSEGAALQVEAVWQPRAENPALTRFLALCRQLYGPEAKNDATLRSPDPSP